MATYFNYVEREADSYVNWADVGRDMSNTIDDIQRVREEKKALIEKTYREDLKFIQDNPSGEHETMNSWSLGVAQSSAEMMRLQNTMLKQGKLSLPNYLTFRQNITDSVEKIYTVNSQLQEAFKEVNDRTKENANQQLERETKVLLEKYGKLQDTEAYINPLNGTIYLGLTEIVEEDGKSVRRLKKGDGTYLSPDQLQAAAIQKFDKFDERPVLKEFVGGLGKVIEEIRIIGGADIASQLNSVTDVTYERIQQIIDALPEDKKPDQKTIDVINAKVEAFKQAETKYIEGILKNPYDALSLLTENGIDIDGNPYNIVFNKADQKTKYDVYVDKTDSKFTPTISPDQNKALTDYLRGQLRVMYDQQAEIKIYNEQRREVVQPRSASAAELEYSERQQTVAGLGTELGKLYNRGLDERQTVLSGLKFYPGVNKGGQLWFSEENNGKDKYLNIIDNNGNDQKFAFEKGGVPVPLETFAGAVAPALYGNPDLVTQQRTAFMNSLNPYKVYNTDWGSGAEDQKRIKKLWSKIEAEPEDPLAPIKNNLPLSVFSKGQTDAATDIRNAIGNLGFKAEATGSWYQNKNYVKVTPPKGSNLEPIEFVVNWSDKGKQEEMQAEVIKLVRQWYEEQARNKPQPPPTTPPTPKINATKKKQGG